MSRKKVEMKQMVCKFRKDGSSCEVFDETMPDEPFMDMIFDTINGLTEVWFEFVKDSRKDKKKVKPFEVIIKI